MQTVPNMYILNLAISDIIYLTELFSEACANRISGTRLDNDFMFTFLPFCRRLSVGLSVYSVALFSIQRYRVTVNPFHVRFSSPPSWLVTVATVRAVWNVAALFAVPSSLSKHLCKEFLTLRQITYYQRVVIFLTLSILCTSFDCDCLDLHHDSPPSCGKLSFYIWGDNKTLHWKHAEILQKWW
jgi:hypothetical protein